MATTTQDIGLAIRDFIEDQEILTWTDADLESGTTIGRDHIEFLMTAYEKVVAEAVYLEYWHIYPKYSYGVRPNWGGITWVKSSLRTS